MTSSILFDIELALEELRESRKALVASWESTNKTSIDMDSRMQSRYDTQKEEYAAQANMIQAQIDRVDELIEMLSNLQRPESFDQVQVGHIVNIQVEHDDEPMRVLLLEDLGGPILCNVQLLSVRSPLGRAILGKKVTETVIYQGPVGNVAVQIKAIS